MGVSFLQFHGDLSLAKPSSIVMPCCMIHVSSVSSILCQINTFFGNAIECQTITSSLNVNRASLALHFNTQKMKLEATGLHFELFTSRGSRLNMFYYWFRRIGFIFSVSFILIFEKFPAGKHWPHHQVFPGINFLSLALAFSYLSHRVFVCLKCVNILIIKASPNITKRWCLQATSVYLFRFCRSSLLPSAHTKHAIHKYCITYFKCFLCVVALLVSFGGNFSDKTIQDKHTYRPHHHFWEAQFNFTTF